MALPFVVPNIDVLDKIVPFDLRIGISCADAGLRSRVESTITSDTADIHDMTAVLQYYS